MTGELTVEAACEQLGIQRPYFQELRQRALAAAAAAMEPQPPGRRPAVTQVEVAELEKLRADNAELRDELDAMMARVNLAMALPHLLRPPGKGGRRSSGQTGSGV
jgi:hypothetical protein